MTQQIRTPDFETYSMAVPVTHAVINDSDPNGVVEVTWSDGHASKYHYMWLRDNCACEHCIDSVSRERVNSILLIPDDTHPTSVTVSPEGGLKVSWSESVGGCAESHYHPGWLRTFDYASGVRPVEEWPIETWGQALEDNLPIFTEVFERVSSQIGLLRDMNWGKISEIIADPDGKYIANRGFALDAHSDASTREYMPGFQIFQCVENTSTGGESFWVDGFHVAGIMKAEYPELFEILTTVGWEFANRSPETHYIYPRYYMAS